MKDKKNNIGFRAFICGIYVLAAAFIFAMWLWSADTPQTSLNGDPRSKLSDLLDGKAHNPFVQRALIPIATRIVETLVPSQPLYQLSGLLLRSEKFRKENLRLGWETERLPSYLIAFSLAFASLFGFLLVMRRLFQQFYITSDLVTNMVPLLSLVGLPPFFLIGTHYIYDFPALLFFTLAMFLLIKQKWRWYYVIYVLGLLNKETMVFLVVGLVAFNYRKRSRQWLFAQTGIHLLLFIAVKGMLLWYFMSNSGGAVEFHLFGNFHNLLLPYSFVSLLVLLSLVLLVIYDFEKKPQDLRILLTLLIPFGLVMICFAWLQEIRDLYEIYPIVFFLALHTLLFSILKIPYSIKSPVL